MKIFYKEVDGGVVLNIRVIPNSSMTAVVGVEEALGAGFEGEYFLKIKLSSPANENKANEELVKFLSKNLKIPKTRIKIVKGEKNKEKKVFVPISSTLLSENFLSL